MTRIAGLLLLLLHLAPRALAAELRWGGDAEGGAPFVEADPNDPSQVARLRRRDRRRDGQGPRPHAAVRAGGLQQRSTSRVARGDFDIGLSGIEDTPARCAALACTVPYFEFREVLTVRTADRDRFRTLADLRGRKVATLGATIAYDMLLAAAAAGRLEVGLVRRRRASVRGPGRRARRRGAARQHPRRALRPPRARARHPAGGGRRRALRRRAGEGERRAARPDQRHPAGPDARRHARAASSAEWAIWNEDQPAFFAAVLGGASRPRRCGLRSQPAPRRSLAEPLRWPTCRRSFAPRSSRSCSRACSMALAVVAGRLHRQRARLRRRCLCARC